ncbi:hypothetical protein Taro_015953 [Colocasia esculenta]|uniref:Uncharacterized protein n=1 Tax=Colocasia esculenta TaxID=4460 RepID=A0A843UJA1_COLES|nr:hypothetical protein [Colocasia esculenta]
MCTVSEPSYLHLVKAFYICLKTEEDGSLTSTVKGTSIHITYDLLERLFGMSIVGHSLVESMGIHAKGLGIIETEYKLRDGKIDINQFNAFNRILHFIVCQILVPRTATFSSCTKGDADVMFWAIQKQEINMAQVIIERMKSATKAIWDRKNKLAVSLPYAHLLTRIFNHLDIDLKGELMEKMGQPIKSRNLKKSGFSLIGNVWTKTSVAESEAIIGEVLEDPPVQEEEAAVREEKPPVPERRIEDIALEHIEPIGQSIEEIVPPTGLDCTVQMAVKTWTPTHSGRPPPGHQPPVGGQTIDVNCAVDYNRQVIAEGAALFEGKVEHTHIEETPNVSVVEAALKESHEDTVAEVVAPGHTKDVHMVDAPAQGEPEVQVEPEIYGETNVSAPADQFQEGLVEDTSDDNVEPVVGSGSRSKGVASKVPLLTRKAHHRSRKKKIHVHIKPVIARLNAHGEILCSLQSDISSIFISQSTGAKEIGAVKNELQEMRSELGSLKKLVTDLSDFVRVHLSAPVPPAPTQSVPEVVGPSGPLVTESEPPGPSLEESGTSVQMESVVGPTGPQVSVEEVVVPPGPSESPNLQTPAPSSPPTSFTAPPAPENFKKPLPKHISSPTPFTTATSSSPSPSSSIPHSTSEAPPASSSSAGPSSAGPSSAGPSTQPPTLTFASFHLPTPPSFITIILEAASVIPHSVHDIKDEFEEAILCTVLAVSTHIHKTDSQPSSNLASKKRKTSSALVFPSNQTLFPPLWYSLSVVNKRRTRYAEYLQKCTFATTFGLPYLNLSEHLNIILPTSGLPKAEQAKILSTAESKTEDQWARANKALYRKFEVARINIFPPKDHPLTLSEWFVCQHRDSWGPFIQKEIKFIRQFQMYQDYCFVNRLPEVQLGQFRGAIALLHTENPANTPLQVDFATLKIPEIAFLPKLHFLFMESEDLLDHKLHYLLSIDKFLQHANFGTAGPYKSSLSNQEYTSFLEDQRLLYIKRLSPEMGPSYNISWGVFRNLFEEQEVRAWQIITRHASRLSPAFYMPTPSNE